MPRVVEIEPTRYRTLQKDQLRRPEPAVEVIATLLAMRWHRSAVSMRLPVADR
jgi:hypothetical protein